MKFIFIAMLFAGCAPIVHNHPAARHVYETTLCSRVRVERVFRGTKNERSWRVVKLNVCGEKVVFEDNGNGWKDVTSRLK
jgi:hypothetical protein